MEARIRGFPIWQGTINWEPLRGGLSNECFTVTDATGKYVVRFGRDLPFHHVSREREMMAARAAYAAGFAPEVVHAAPGVMVVRFIEGKTFGPGDVRANIPRIADIVRRFHAEMPAHVSGPGFMFWVFHVIRDYALTLEAGGSRVIPRLPEFLALSEEMERAQVPMPIVYGHHDFLPANFVDDGSRLWLIDFEYAGFGTAMFDLAGIASNAGFDAAQAAELLGCYIGSDPTDELLRSHAAMQCASLLREAMWSMVSELHLDTDGVDFVAYTEEQLKALEAAHAAYNHRFRKVVNS
ncbi:MAG: phosphotransferase [Gammaproteobacteria bacterium]|nr:phosphotransferase [Gammaproteobacteria bacterium]MCZ6894570.1 phosphotransferase [Gammaproteobacteria bacterium]